MMTQSQKLTKAQKEALLRAFQAIKRAAEAGERFVIQSDKSDNAIELICGQVRGMVELVSEIENSLRLSFGATMLLEHIVRVRRRVDRTGLRLVKGGK